MPAISVVIPTYNRGSILLDTIHDVLNQSFKDLELLVIDQTNPQDATVLKNVRAITDQRLRYVQTDPPSLPAARNFAMTIAHSPLVLYIDDDVKLTKDMVRHHVARFADTPGLSAVAGRVMQDGFPVKKEVLQFDEYAVSHGVFTATQAGYTNAFPGGNCCLKVADALKVGGFDTRYRGNAFREESDMSLKMSRAGMKIYYEPKAELLHLAAHSGGLRVKGHIFDSQTFYNNEMLFTLRGAQPGKRLKAIHRKYVEYCKLQSRRVRLRRSVLFCKGLVYGVWKAVFGKQLVQTERAK